MVAPRFATPGKHEIKVCAGYPCFTGSAAQSASQTIEITAPMPVSAAQIAYVYANDQAGLGADALLQFTDLLQAYGMTVKPVRMEEIGAVDFTQFDLVIVASNTGKLDLWGTPEQADQLAKSPRILALGEGGYALFGKIAPDLGYPNGKPYDELDPHPGTVILVDPELTFGKTPHNFQAFVQRAIQIAPDPGTYSIKIPQTSDIGDSPRLYRGAG